MANTLLPEIRRAFASAARGRRPQPDRKFNPDDEYVAYGLKVAQQRQIWKAFRPRLAGLTLKERLDLAAKLLATHIGELGHAGIYVLGLSVHELGPQHFAYLDRLLHHFRGWSHVDDFCGSVMQPLLARHPQAVVALAEKWSRSPNRWKRRASVVAFTRKVGESGRFTDVVLRLCDNLVWDDEDLVQKGVGWALKDNLRSAPERILPYVKKLRREGAPSTITLYAIRDLRGATRRDVLSVKASGARR